MADFEISVLDQSGHGAARLPFSRSQRFYTSHCLESWDRAGTEDGSAVTAGRIHGQNQLPTQAPQWITIPGLDHLNPLESEKLCVPFVS